MSGQTGATATPVVDDSALRAAKLHSARPTVLRDAGAVPAEINLGNATAHHLRGDEEALRAQRQRGLAGNFSYQLDNLMDHFIRKTDEGDALRQPGRRVVVAVLSGAVTETPRIEPTRIDRSCPSCGASVEIRYTEARLEGYWTECAGVERATRSAGTSADGADGLLGQLPLPPAGIEDRGVAEVEDAAWTWGSAI
ncbi:MAG: hypothetical protein V5A24_02280 [Haloarculaceae archaeon]